MEKYDEDPIWNEDQAANATAKQVEEYIQARIEDYKEDNMNGDELFDMWKGDFASFTTVTFGKAREVTKILRDFLRANGVYIKKSGCLIADELYKMLRRKYPETWPINEKDRPSWLAYQLIQKVIQPTSMTSTQPSTQPLTQPSTQEGRLQNNLINLSKLYTDEQKYSGDSDNFEFKYSIFPDPCEHAEVPEDTYLKACSKFANTANSLISDLGSSITTYRKIQGRIGQGQCQHFMDRQCYSNPRQSGYQNCSQYQNHEKNSHNRPHKVRIKRCFTCGLPLLHVVDEATRFQAARWLDNGISAVRVWEALRMSWIDTYLGPPDLVTHDSGTSFAAEEFQQYTNSLTIATYFIGQVLSADGLQKASLHQNYMQWAMALTAHVF
jgi:hypothetical protein